MQKHWYAVYTKPKCEKKVSAVLTKKKIENYCPLNRIFQEGLHDRKKLQLEPLFPNFVFVHIMESEMPFVKQQNDIINFVYWLGRPVEIRSMEIENIQEFIDSYSNIQLEKTQVSLNKMVRVVNKAPIREVDGNVITMLSNIVKVTLPSLGFVLCANTADEVFEVEALQLGVRNLVS